MDVMPQLRDATQDIHRRLEDLPLAQALAQGRIGLRAYAGLLRQLVHLHDSAEAVLDRHPELGVYRPAMARRAVLLRDLQALGCDPAAPALPAVRAFAARLEAWSSTTPVALLGCLYVLEGSRLGSLHLVQPLAAALGVAPTPGAGLDYHLDGRQQRPQLWLQFKLAMNAAVSDPAQQAVVVDAALATFGALYDLYAALPPQPPAAPQFAEAARSLTAALPV